MAKTRILHEFGLGTSLRRADYTGAAERAIRDAIWRNSISAAELFGFDKSDMQIEVELGIAQPEAVDPAALRKIFPYGSVKFSIRPGGLDIPKPDGQVVTIIANAAVIVFFDMEPVA